jgi:hypothetical protein
MDREDDFDSLPCSRRTYVGRLRCEKAGPLVPPPVCPSALDIPGHLLAPDCLHALLREAAAGFSLPASVVSLLFESLSDRSLDPGIAGPALSVLAAWSSVAARAAPPGWAALLPRDALAALQMWVPHPGALAVLALAVRASRDLAAAFSAPLCRDPEAFGAFYGALLRGDATRVPVLDLVLALAHYDDLLEALAPVVGRVLALLPAMRAAAARRAFAIVAECARNADLVSSLLNKGRLGAVFALLGPGDAALLGRGLRALGRIALRLKPGAASDLVSGLPLRRLWIAAVEDRNEFAIRELCFIFGIVCADGVDAVAHVLEMGVVHRIVGICSAVSFATRREIADFLCILIVEASDEQLRTLMHRDLVLAVCGALAETHELVLDGRFGEIGSQALSRICEVLEGEWIEFLNPADQQLIAAMAEVENRDFHPITDFAGRLNALACGTIKTFSVVS